MAKNNLIANTDPRAKWKYSIACPRAYWAWQAMLSRCYKQNHPFYKNYGGRGILVCNEWSVSADAFIIDMGEPPIGMSLERVNNNGGYSKENCRWATRKEQQRNTRATKILCIKGEKISIGEAAERYGINYKTLSKRIRMGISADIAVSLPLSRPYEIRKLLELLPSVSDRQTN